MNRFSRLRLGMVSMGLPVLGVEQGQVGVLQDGQVLGVLLLGHFGEVVGLDQDGLPGGANGGHHGLLVAHPSCAHVAPGLMQCVIYASNRRNARLIGIE